MVDGFSFAEDALPKGGKKESGAWVGLCTGGDLLGVKRGFSPLVFTK